MTGADPSGWSWSATSTAQKELRKLGGQDQTRVLDELDRLAAHDSGLNVKKLSGKFDGYVCWRLRVGTLRVVYTKDSPNRCFVVLRVDDRKNVYR